jgi:hypothetical protein
MKGFAMSMSIASPHIRPVTTGVQFGKVEYQGDNKLTLTHDKPDTLFPYISHTLSIEVDPKARSFEMNRWYYGDKKVETNLCEQLRLETKQEKQSAINETNRVLKIFKKRGFDSRDLEAVKEWTLRKINATV